MSSTRIRLHHSGNRWDDYIARPAGRGYRVFDKQYGFLASNIFLGEVRNLDDAIALAKANAKERVVHVSLSDE